MTYEDLVKVNKTIKTTPIRGKQYAEVAQRVKAFRMLYPEGSIRTEMLSNDNGICVFKASICTNSGALLGTGTAYEKEGSTNINKTSHIENCETSAVGRALAMCGFGIDVSVASYEEVENAIEAQEAKTAAEEKVTDAMITSIRMMLLKAGKSEQGMLDYMHRQNLSDLTTTEYRTMMDTLEKWASKKEARNE